MMAPNKTSVGTACGALVLLALTVKLYPPLPGTI